MTEAKREVAHTKSIHIEIPVVSRGERATVDRAQDVDRLFGGLTEHCARQYAKPAMPHMARRARYEWITSRRSNMPTNCSIFFARVSALFTV